MQFSCVLNAHFKEMLRGPGHDHIFFQSFEWWKRAIESWKKKEFSLSQDKPPPQQLPLVPPKHAKKCKFVPSQVMQSSRLEKLYDLLQTTDDFDALRPHLLEMYDYLLPSTIKDPVNQFTPDTYNILIVGAGPVGLYTALYFYHYLNNVVKKPWKLLVVDNRVVQEGLRLPYTRLTQFGFNKTDLQPFIPKISCWKSEAGDMNRHFDFIAYLENFMYILAFHKRIPMYFTKTLETYDSVLHFAENHGINLILDCTGGRLRRAPPQSSLDWSDINMTKSSCEVKQDPEGWFRLHENGKPYVYTTYAIKLLDKRHKEIPVGNLFSHPSHQSDVELMKQYQGLCMTRKEYDGVALSFRGKSLRALLPALINSQGLQEQDVAYVVITPFDVFSHHAPAAAESIDEDRVYVGLGDTLGTSEYGIHFGLRTALIYSRHLVHLVASLMIS